MRPSWSSCSRQRWGLSAGIAGLALTGVGLSWSAASWGQSRVSRTVSDRAAMRVGSATVLAGILGLALLVWVHAPAFVAAAAYVLAGAGMGFAYPRTSVAMLAEVGGLRARVQLRGALDRRRSRRGDDDRRFGGRFRGRATHRR